MPLHLSDLSDWLTVRLIMRFNLVPERCPSLSLKDVNKIVTLLDQAESSFILAGRLKYVSFSDCYRFLAQHLGQGSFNLFCVFCRDILLELSSQRDVPIDIPNPADSHKRPRDVTEVPRVAGNPGSTSAPPMAGPTGANLGPPRKGGPRPSAVAAATIRKTSAETRPRKQTSVSNLKIHNQSLPFGSSSTSSPKMPSTTEPVTSQHPTSPPIQLQHRQQQHSQPSSSHLSVASSQQGFPPRALPTQTLPQQNDPSLSYESPWLNGGQPRLTSSISAPNSNRHSYMDLGSNQQQMFQQQPQLHQLHQQLSSRPSDFVAPNYYPASYNPSLSLSDPSLTATASDSSLHSYPHQKHSSSNSVASTASSDSHQHATPPAMFDPHLSTETSLGNNPGVDLTMMYSPSSLYTPLYHHDGMNNHGILDGASTGPRDDRVRGLSTSSGFSPSRFNFSSTMPFEISNGPVQGGSEEGVGETGYTGFDEMLDSSMEDTTDLWSGLPSGFS